MYHDSNPSTCKGHFSKITICLTSNGDSILTRDMTKL